MIFNRHADEARDYLGLPKIPGNLFEQITEQKNYIDKYKIVIFKEDLDKLSGFIGYEKDFAFIGVNFKRPIGHQNLTLAHELGHFFLHKGLLFSDKNYISKGGTSKEEKEAFDFASELLCPHEKFCEEIYVSQLTCAFHNRNFAEIGKWIDCICHKYYLSFVFVLRKTLYYFHLVKDYKKYNEKIKESVGGLSALDKNFYVADGSSYSKPCSYPYEHLRQTVLTAIADQKIGEATGKSILYSYNLLGDDEN